MSRLRFRLARIPTLGRMVIERTQDRLEGSHWLGTLLSPVGGFRTTTSGYKEASAYRNGLDDKLQRLSEIIAAIGRRS